MAVAAGFVAGLAILTRANGMILLLPLALMVWAPRRSFGPPAVLVAVALLTVAPWTIRNAVELHAFVPVTTQFGAALAGTYNDEARTDREDPASWRTIRGVKAYLPLTQPWYTTPEVVIERRLRDASLDYIREHPGYVATVLYWNTRRLLDLASWRWSRHTASTVSVEETVGRPRRRLLLDRGRARAGRRPQAALGAVVGVGGAVGDVPECRVHGRRDAALPRADRPVPDPARGARSHAAFRTVAP